MFRPSLPTLLQRVRTRIKRAHRAIYLPADFMDFSGKVQVYRALKQLVDEGTLLRVGHGLYARAQPNPSTGAPEPAVSGGFDAVARSALNRLGVPWEPSSLEVAFKPAGSNVVLRLRTPLRRSIGWAGMRVVREPPAPRQTLAAHMTPRLMALRLLRACEMHDLGVQMYRQTLERRHPQATSAEVDRMLQAWLAGPAPRRAAPSTAIS